MKKTSALIRTTALSLALMLAFSGCTSDNANAPASPIEAELIDEIPEAETAANTASNTASVRTSDALNKAFENIAEEGGLCLGYTSDGKYEPIDYDEYSSAVYAQYMASEEFYKMAMDEYAEYAEYEEYSEYKDMTYEEFKNEMYSLMGIDPADAEKYAKYAMFVTVEYYGYGEEEDADHSAAAKKGFDFFTEKLSADKTFSPDKLGELKTISVTVRKQGDVLTVSAGYDDKDGETVYIAKDETVSLLGEGYVLIGNKAVPADTKSLYISTQDMEFEEKLCGYDKNEYETAVFNYMGTEDGGYSYSSKNDSALLDLTDIAEKLPNLKKLHVSHFITITGFEGLKKYGSFAELEISEWHVAEENTDVLAGLSNVKKLSLFDVKEKKDIEWTANAKFKELAFDCDHPREELLKFVYSMENVTGLKLSYCTDLDFNGIENMTGLKKLEIDIDTYYNEEITNFAPLAKLKALEELAFTGDNGKNFESIGRIKTLKKLTLSDLRSGWEDEKIDLSGLASCTSLEYLDISDVDYSIHSAIPNMKKLKKIRFGEYSSPDGLEELEDLKSLEEIVFEEHSTVDLTGISKLKKLQRVTITESDIENASEINDCTSLKYLSIEGGKYDVFDVEALENNAHIEEFSLNIWNLMHYKSFKTMTALKNLNIVSRSLDEKQIDDLKKSMPSCKIEVTRPPEENDDGEDTEEDDYISYAEPLETLNIGDVRIESYYLGEDFWEKRMYVKNCGSEPVENLPEFLKENGFTEGRSEIYISYPERDGDEYSEVIEIISITDNVLDYDNHTVYLSAFGIPDEDYVDNCRYRALQPGCTAEVLLPIKGKSRDEY